MGQAKAGFRARKRIEALEMDKPLWNSELVWQAVGDYGVAPQLSLDPPGQVKPARQIGESFRGAGAKCIYSTNLSPVAPCTAKFGQRFVMLIPNVWIHTRFSPPPQA